MTVTDLPTRAADADARGATSSRSRRVAPRTRLRPPPPKRWVVWTLRLALLAILVGGWQLLAHSSEHWHRILSSPYDIGHQLWEWIRTSAYRNHVRVTMTEAVFGYALGIGFALVLVAITAPSETVGKILSPFITTLAAIPKLALTPLFIIWFGVSLRSKVYFIAVAIFFIVFQGVSSGLKTIDRPVLDNMRALGASKLHLLKNVYIPSVFTWLMTGLRLSASLALLAAVGAEYLGSTEGVGFVIKTGEESYSPTIVLAGVTTIAVIAVLVDRLLLRVEARFTKWRLF